MRAVVVCVVLLVCSCRKNPLPPALPLSVNDTAHFIEYIIPAGAHYATSRAFVPIETDTLQFLVRFDSSAVYQAAQAQNQYDINKLYGFSDNGAGHHQYSARLGWRWSDGALRLFGYVYNEGRRESAELGTASIGRVLQCSIIATPQQYRFRCNESECVLPRKSTTAKGKGYLLFPYFGGNEAAPHAIHILIKNIKL